MANTTILNAVSTNQVSSGSAITGPSVVHVNGLLHSESVGVEVAQADSEANYRRVATLCGPDPSPVNLNYSASAAYFVRMRLYGVASGRSGTITGVVVQ